MVKGCQWWIEKYERFLKSIYETVNKVPKNANIIIPRWGLFKYKNMILKEIS